MDTVTSTFTSNDNMLTASFTSNDANEESKDKPSPLKPQPKKKKQRPTLDISGGIGTPVYKATTSNLFDQDDILGKKPLGMPLLVTVLLRITCSGDYNILRELWVAVQILCSLVLGMNTFISVMSSIENQLTTLDTLGAIATLLVYPIVVLKFHSFFWSGEGMNILDFKFLTTKTRRYVSSLSLLAMVFAVVVGIFGIVNIVTTPLGSFAGGFNREWLAITSNTTQDAATPTGPVLFWWIIHRVCFFVVQCTMPASCAAIFPLFVVKSTNQMDSIAKMTADMVGIIKETDPATNDDEEERQEMFDLFEQKFKDGQQWMHVTNQTLSQAILIVAVYLTFSMAMLTIDIVMPMSAWDVGVPIALYFCLFILFTCCLLLITTVATGPDAEFNKFLNALRGPSTICHLSYPGFGLTEFMKGVERRRREHTWIFFGWQMNQEMHNWLWVGCVVWVSVVISTFVKK